MIYHKYINIFIALSLFLWVDFCLAEQKNRYLSYTETVAVIHALLENPLENLSDDPSCKYDLNQKSPMLIRDGLALTLAQAAIDTKSLKLKVDCFIYPGYPVKDKEEWCRMVFLPNPKISSSGFGLVFLMDWNTKKLSNKNQVACSGFY